MWPWRRVHLGQRLERGHPLLLGLADADQDAARERDPQLTRRLDRREPLRAGAWSASRRAPCPSGARTPTRASGPSTRSPRAAAPGPRGSSTPRLECGSSPRSSARSQAHTTYEVKSSWPYSRSRCGDLGVDLRHLARQDQQLLAAAPGRVVEHAAPPRPARAGAAVRRERAVLAVAAAGARQRQRVVAREGDAPHGQHEV